MLSPGIALVESPYDSEVPIAEQQGTTSFSAEVGVFERYCGTVRFDMGRLHNVGQKTVQTLRDFSCGGLNPDTYRAAMLSPLTIGLTDEPATKKNVFRALHRYSSDIGETSWEFVSGLLADQTEVHRQASASHTVLVGRSPALALALRGQGSERVDKEVWLEPSTMLPIAEMMRDISRVNLESILIAASRTLVQLRDAQAKDNERQILQLIHRTESYYAPVCEVIGYDGLAAVLRSEANIIRLQKAGLGDFVDKANELLGQADEKQTVHTKVQKLLGVITGAEFDTDFAFGDSSGHGMTLGIGLLQREGDMELSRAVWRYKTVGSLAMKMARQNTELWNVTPADRMVALEKIVLPADVIGITIISPDANSLASHFSHAAVEASKSTEIEFVTSPSREHSLHVKGKESFTRLMVGALALNGVTGERLVREATEVVIATVRSPYQVAKFTCKFAADGAPIEVQFLTEEQRLASRVGVGAHVLHKLRKQAKGSDEQVYQDVTPEALVELARVHARREEVGGHALVAGSVRRGVDFRVQVARSKPVEHTWKALTRRK